MQCAPKTSGFLLSLSGALRGCAIGLIGAGLVSAGAVLAQDQAPTPAQRQLRELYKELVEIDQEAMQKLKLSFGPYHVLVLTDGKLRYHQILPFDESTPVPYTIKLMHGQ